MATTDTLPPSPVQSQPPVQRPNPRPAAAPVAERSVFASLDRMQVKRDPKSTMLAIGVHVLIIGLIAYLIATKTTLITPKKAETISLVAPPPPPPKAPPKAVTMGGGGGQKGPTPVTKGNIPPPSPVQLNPPKAPPTVAPKINVPVTVDIDKNLKMAKTDVPNFGAPNSPLVGMSMGNGNGTGIGSGNGGGVGPGTGGNTGGGLRRIGGGVSAPVPLSMPEPEFSEEARKAKVQGIVTVYLEVDTNGRPVNVRVLRGIGMGLDEKAIEAVRQYKFKPAMENGHAVRVPLNIEVNFQIF